MDLTPQYSSQTDLPLVLSNDNQEHVIQNQIIEMNQQMLRFYENAQQQFQSQLNHMKQWQQQISNVMNYLPLKQPERQVKSTKPVKLDGSQPLFSGNPKRLASNPFPLPSEIWNLIHQDCFSEPSPCFEPTLRRVCARWAQDISLPNISIRTISLARLRPEQIVESFHHARSLTITDNLPLRRIAKAISSSGPSLTHIALGKKVRPSRRDEEDFVQDMEALDDCLGHQGTEKNSEKKTNKRWSLSLYQYDLEEKSIFRVSQLIQQHALYSISLNIPKMTTEHLLQPIFECPCLNRLEILGIRIQGWEFLVAIAEGISENTTLKSLSLQGDSTHLINSIYHIPVAGQRVMDAFKKNSTLTELHLNHIDSEVISACCLSSSITSLQIRWSNVSDQQKLKVLMEPLGQCVALKSFQLHLSGYTTVNDDVWADKEERPKYVSLDDVIEEISTDSILMKAKNLEQLMVNVSDMSPGTNFDGNLTDPWSEWLAHILETHASLRFVELPIRSMSKATETKLFTAISKSPRAMKLIYPHGVAISTFIEEKPAAPSDVSTGPVNHRPDPFPDPNSSDSDSDRDSDTDEEFQHFLKGCARY